MSEKLSDEAVKKHKALANEMFRLINSYMTETLVDLSAAGTSINDSAEELKKLLTDYVEYMRIFLQFDGLCRPTHRP